jgi:two-component system, NtrC family, sensor kinase
MKLRNRLLLTNLLTVVCLLSVSGAAIWAVWTMAGSLGWVAAEYNELRLIDQANNDLAVADGLLRSDRPDFNAIDTKLNEAVQNLRSFMEIQGDDEYGVGADVTAEHQDAEQRTSNTITRSLESIAQRAHELQQRASAAPDVGQDHGGGVHQMSASIRQIRSDLSTLAKEADDAVLHAHDRGRTARSSSILTLTVVCIFAILVVAISGLSQYRAVVPTLARMRDRVREIASGRLDKRLAYRGKDELTDLAVDFNRMVAELESLYQNLEERVETKSRQLVRSERLASVGYLAAGIAHEINNPLSIIAGHAELALKDLEKRPNGTEDAESVEGLEIIRDEAFRCKQIIEKLLSLIRNPDAPLTVVGLGPMAHEVASLVRGLKHFRGRTLDIQIPPDEKLDVAAHEAEMKQVLLNLTINAMEAVEDGNGHVQITGHINDGAVSVSVIDNGHGMPPDVLSRAFEPFFTQKRGAEERGNGLGLSIVHAIIQDHGGSIEAYSDGPGCGCRFTFRLPIAEPQDHHEHPRVDQSIA